jgi:hypothetical protein
MSFDQIGNGFHFAFGLDGEVLPPKIGTFVATHVHRHLVDDGQGNRKTTTDFTSLKYSLCDIENWNLDQRYRSEKADKQINSLYCVDQE